MFKSDKILNVCFTTCVDYYIKMLEAKKTFIAWVHIHKREVTLPVFIFLTHYKRKLLVMYSGTNNNAEVLHSYFLAKNPRSNIALNISTVCAHHSKNKLHVFLCDSDIKNDRIGRILKGSNTRCSAEAILVSYWRI